jgi:AcrR family transcriptional regulator
MQPLDSCLKPVPRKSRFDQLVAQRVGVMPPSVYLHFADKRAMMDAARARYVENSTARCSAPAPAGPEKVRR